MRTIVVSGTSSVLPLVRRMSGRLGVFGNSDSRMGWRSAALRRTGRSTRPMPSWMSYPSLGKWAFRGQSWELRFLVLVGGERSS